MTSSGAATLAAASVDFNLAPIATVDPSWLSAMAHGALIEQLRGEPAAQGWLSAHLLGKFDISDAYWTDFGPSRHRLALVDPPILQLLCLRLGLVLRGEEVRREIDGARLKALAARIGEDNLQFAVRAAPLLGRPPAFDYESGIREVRLRYMMIGAAFALPSVAMADRGYATRVALRLPREMHEELFGLAALRPASEEPTLPTLAKRILREVGPSWLPLFD